MAIGGEKYGRERRLASLAVQRACIVTQKVYQTQVKQSIEKSDESPVTVGDFAAQALIISALRHAFPADAIVGEEEASALRSSASLASQVWNLVRETRLLDIAAEQEVGGPISSESEMLDIIDAGSSPGGSTGRIWALDPIDGTKGFLRGGQYAVCLALIEAGEVRVGVLGCPNLPVDNAVTLAASPEINEDRGVLFAAEFSQGATSRPLGHGDLHAESSSIQMNTPSDISAAVFCESVEAAHSSHSDQAQITSLLGIIKPSIRMDSQAKYASIARGAADLYLRLPVKKSYEEKIWDHAAGDLIVREAGGHVTDAKGKRLDFGQGRTLKANQGVVAAPAALHPLVLEAVRKVLDAKL